MAQCSSSLKFKQTYPQTASNYWTKAQLGWKFLTNAIAIHGLNGAYQKIQHFGDAFTDRDELAWAACEMFLATGDANYHDLLKTWFPDPTDPIVPQHRVPLNARGEFVIFAPEKSLSSIVTLDVFHPGGVLAVITPQIFVHRSAVIPLITVP